MITLKMLVENRENGKFNEEFGLSVLVDTHKNKFLFDTGYSNLFIENAKRLKVNLDKVDKVILSHGHNDHSNGIQFLPNRKTIILHPQTYKPRWALSTNKFSGFPISKQELMEKHNVVERVEPLKFYEDCYYLGEIPMTVSYEKNGNFATALDEELTQIDFTEDDSAVAITTNKGLFVMTGCGHRGICNAVEHAKKVTGQNKVYAIFGGFHLNNLEGQKAKIEGTIEYIKQNDIKLVFLGHCISDKVINYFKQNLKNVRIIKLAAGKTYNLFVTPLSSIKGNKMILDKDIKKQIYSTFDKEEEIDDSIADEVFTIVKKIIALHRNKTFTIAQLINYNAKNDIVNPLRQGKVSYCVKQVCKAFNIELIVTERSFGGLAYHIKHKKM